MFWFHAHSLLLGFASPASHPHRRSLIFLVRLVYIRQAFSDLPLPFRSLPSHSSPCRGRGAVKTLSRTRTLTWTRPWLTLLITWWTLTSRLLTLARPWPLAPVPTLACPRPPPPALAQTWPLLPLPTLARPLLVRPDTRPNRTLSLAAHSWWLNPKRSPYHSAKLTSSGPQNI